MPRGPACVAVTVEGGVCVSPVPILSALFGLEVMGRIDEGMLSPGRTIVSAAMVDR